jgi:hypothetical protein
MGARRLTVSQSDVVTLTSFITNCADHNFNLDEEFVISLPQKHTLIMHDDEEGMIIYHIYILHLFENSAQKWNYYLQYKETNSLSFPSSPLVQQGGTTSKARKTKAQSSKFNGGGGGCFLLQPPPLPLVGE